MSGQKYVPIRCNCNCLSPALQLLTLVDTKLLSCLGLRCSWHTYCDRVRGWVLEAGRCVSGWRWLDTDKTVHAAVGCLWDFVALRI